MVLLRENMMFLDVFLDAGQFHIIDREDVLAALAAAGAFAICCEVSYTFAI